MNDYKKMHAEIWHADTMNLAESPVWNADTSTLHWVDISNGVIYCANEQHEAVKKLTLGAWVPNIVCAQNATLVAALSDGVYNIDETGNKIKALGAPEDYEPAVRFNDGKCDESGRLFIGTCSSQKSNAKLYCYDKQAGWRTVLSGVTISNGIVWNKNNTIMYYADSKTGKVDAFDYCLQTGTVDNRTTAFSFAPDEGMPDGMAIDAEGMLWVAMWGGGRVYRLNPNSKKILCEVLLPVPNVSACAFGGADMQTLYITTARLGLSEDELDQYPLSGSIFALRTDVKGVAFHTFDL